MSSFHGLKCVGDEPLTVCSRDPKGSPSRRVVCCWSPVFLVVVPAAGLEALQDRCRFVSRTRELAAFTLWWKAGLHTHLLYLLAETRGAPRASVFILGGGGHLGPAARGSPRLGGADLNLWVLHGVVLLPPAVFSCNSQCATPPDPPGKPSAAARTRVGRRAPCVLCVGVASPRLQTLAVANEARAAWHGIVHASNSFSAFLLPEGTS